MAVRRGEERRGERHTASYLLYTRRPERMWRRITPLPPQRLRGATRAKPRPDVSAPMFHDLLIILSRCSQIASSITLGKNSDMSESRA